MKVFERNNQFLSMILEYSLQERKRRHILPVRLIFRGEMHGRFTIPEVLQALWEYITINNLIYSGSISEACYTHLKYFSALQRYSHY